MFAGIDVSKNILDAALLQALVRCVESLEEMHRIATVATLLLLGFLLSARWGFISVIHQVIRVHTRQIPFSSKLVVRPPGFGFASILHPPGVNHIRVAAADITHRKKLS